MAGVGWKLQQQLDRGTLAGTTHAYVTGVAATSAPWVITAVSLLGLRLLARSHGIADVVGVERVLTLTYALTTVLCAPIEIIISRYTSDKLYERHLAQVAAPLRRTLTTVLCALFLAGGAAVLLLDETPTVIALGALLTAFVGGQWIVLTVASGLTSPSVPITAYLLGAATNVLSAAAFWQWSALGAAGFLLASVIGGALTLVLLLRSTLRALPREDDEAAQILPAFAKYRALALAALAYATLLWVDKLVVLLTSRRTEAETYVTAATLAWFSVLPVFAWIFVRMETAFYRRFAAFYHEIGAHASLAELREAERLLRAECARLGGGAATVQAIVLAVFLLATPSLLAAAGLPPAAGPSFRLLLLSSGVQALAFLGLLLLYYFDLRRTALLAASSHLVATLSLTVLAWRAGLPIALGYASASFLGGLLSWGLLRRRLRTLLVDTFQSQPYANEA